MMHPRCRSSHTSTGGGRNRRRASRFVHLPVGWGASLRSLLVPFSALLQTAIDVPGGKSLKITDGTGAMRTWVRCYGAKAQSWCGLDAPL
jgi:hypothetical protein